MHIITQVYQSVWAVEEAVFTQLLEVVERKARGERIPAEALASIAEDRARRTDARARAMEDDDKEPGKAGPVPEPEGVTENRASTVGKVRIVPVMGVVAPRASMVNGISQPMGTSSDRVAADIAAAAEDPAVAGILLHLDSPGGEVAGTERVVQAVREARKAKPVHAYTAGMAASAAYWIAAAADRVTAARSAMVGSIGVFAVRDDSSKVLAQRGVTRHVIRSGKYKGSGVEGTPISDADRAKWQGEVDAIHSIFAGDVAAFRSLTPDQIAAVADGRVFTGQDAVALRLVDGVGGISQALRAVEAAAAMRVTPSGPGRPRMVPSHTPPGARPAMTETELQAQHPEVVARIQAAAVEKFKNDNAPRPDPAATVEQLAEAFGAKEGGQAFCFECLTQKLSLAGAHAAWAGKVEAHNATLRQQLADVAKKGPPAGASPAVPVFTPGSPHAGQAPPGEPSTFAEAVKLVEARDKVKRPVAMARAAKEYRALHEAWTEAGFPAVV